MLPESVTSLVGRRGIWHEDRVVVKDGHAVFEPQQELHLVLGARWARNVDGKPVGEQLGLVQYLMERPDGTSRWTNPVVPNS